MILREGMDICLAHCPTRGSALGHPPWAWPGCLLWVCRGGHSSSASIMHFRSCPRFNPLPGEHNAAIQSLLFSEAGGKFMEQHKIGRQATQW